MTHTTQLFLTLWTRYAIVWRKLWFNFLCLRVIEPALIMYGLGFGLSLAYNQVAGVPYLNFVVPGIMCSTLLFACLLDGIYGTLARTLFQGLCTAQLATNNSLRMILLAESTWASVKGTTGAGFVMLVGFLYGGVENLGTVFMALPLLFIGGSTLASLGQIIAARARGVEDVDFVWAFLVSPMFIFCGTFIPLESFPNLIQLGAQVFPLTHLIELVRGHVLSTLTWGAFLFHLGTLLLFWAVSHEIAYRFFKQKLLA